MATPVGFKVRTAQILLAALLFLEAVLNIGASFPQTPFQPTGIPLKFHEPVFSVVIHTNAPVRQRRDLGRIESMLFAERAVSVSA